MPQVFRLFGYVIFFWSNENGEPPHVHVSKGSPQKGATKIWMEKVPRLAHNNSHIPSKDLNRIMQWLAANRDMVIAEWYDHFE